MGGDRGGGRLRIRSVGLLLLAIPLGCGGSARVSNRSTRQTLPDTGALLAELRITHREPLVGIEQITPIQLQFDSASPAFTVPVTIVTFVWPDSGPPNLVRDSLEIKVFAAGPDGVIREIFTTGAQHGWDGCGALWQSVPGVRSLSGPGYSLIAVLEQHEYVVDCLGNGSFDTTTTTFFNARRPARPLLVLEDRVVTVIDGECNHPPPGVECSVPDTTTVRRSEYRIDAGGLHVSQQVSKGKPGFPAALYSWSSDSTALVPKP